MFLPKSISKRLAKLLILLMFITNPACTIAVHAATSTDNTATTNDTSITTLKVDKSAKGQEATALTTKDGEHLSEQEKALKFSNSLLNYYLQNGKGKGPKWLKTTDVQFLFTEEHKPIYSVESLQPFGGVKDNGSLWFWQGRYAHESQASSTANLGLGWRKLSADKSSMIGFNTFYDYGFQYNLERIGLGAEYFNKQAEYRANFYHPVSGDRQTGVSYLDGGVLTSYIRAVEGVDFEAGTSFTHMPWLKLYASAYYWDNKYNDDEKGYKLRSTLQLTPRVNMELGYYNSNLNHSFYGKVNYQLAFDSMSPLVSRSQKKKVNINDVSSKLLQKVQRENDIKTETYTKLVAYKGNIKTTVTNSLNSTALVGAVVQAYQNGAAVGNAVTTDPSGQALISGLNAGTYTMNVTYANYSGISQAVTVTKDQTSATAVSLAVNGGSATLTVVNAQSQAVNGATVVATLKNTTVAAAERSVIDRILGVKIAYAGTSSYSFTATTDANGVATFTNLPPGTYTFTCTENGLSMQSQDVTVTAGSSSTITLLVSNSGGNVIAVVKSTSGALLSGATVNVLSGSTVVASGTTDQSGIALLGGITAGTYTLAVSLTNYVSSTTNVTVTDRGTSSSNIALTAQAMGTAQITVTDGTHSLSGATVSTTVSGVTYSGTTNNAGIATISLPAGTYTFAASMSGYSTNAGNSVAITSSSTTSGTIALSGAGSVSIMINDGTNAISGATVSTTINGTTYSGTTNSSGVATISGVPTGTYSFVASATGYNSSTGNIGVTTAGASGTFSLSAVVVAPPPAIPSYAITATVTGGVGGTITPAGGSAISTTGTTNVTYNGSQSYTITANTGYVISSITVDGSTSVPVTGSPQTYLISNVTAVHSLVVTFAAQSYAITATVTGGTGGTITPAGGSAISTTGTTNVTYNGSQSYTIAAATGYTIASITVDGSTTVTVAGSPQTYTFNNVTAAHSIAVYFAAQTYAITATVTGGTGGTITPSGGSAISNTGTMNVTYNSSQSYTIVAATGYAIASITVDGVAPVAVTGSPQLITFTNVSGTRSLTVSFSIATVTFKYINMRKDQRYDITSQIWNPFTRDCTSSLVGRTVYTVTLPAGPGAMYCYLAHNMTTNAYSVVGWQAITTPVVTIDMTGI